MFSILSDLNQSIKRDENFSEKIMALAGLICSKIFFIHNNTA